MEEFDRNLIMLVEGNQHLYNKEMPEYKDKIRCQNTWKSIGARFKIPRKYIFMYVYLYVEI